MKCIPFGCCSTFPRLQVRCSVPRRNQHVSINYAVHTPRKCLPRGPAHTEMSGAREMGFYACIKEAA
jgi:hypothetical protein